MLKVNSHSIEIDHVELPIAPDLIRSLSSNIASHMAWASGEKVQIDHLEWGSGYSLFANADGKIWLTDNGKEVASANVAPVLTWSLMESQINRDRLMDEYEANP